MIRPPPAPAPKAKTVEQQNTDFTAEGSPPPGAVGTAIPAEIAPPTPVDKRKRDREARYPRAKIHRPTSGVR